MKKSNLMFLKLFVGVLESIPRQEIRLDNPCKLLYLTDRPVVIIDSKWLDDISFEIQKIILEEEMNGE
jgi:hypothetical protein